VAQSKSQPKLLSLYPGAKPCVRCGFCCKVRSCGFGEWDYEKKQCKELIDNGDETYNCGAFERITSLPQEVWYTAPAFGAGCCSSLNTDRERVLRKGKAPA